MARQRKAADEKTQQPGVAVKVIPNAPLEQLAACDPVVVHPAKPSPPELTELHEAIVAKNLKRVKGLIQRGVDVNACHSNFDLGFPLPHALSVGDKRIIRVLLEAGADPNLDDYLADCIEENDLPMAKLLVAHGADLNGQLNDDSETNLIRAARLGRTAFVKLLLEAGADPNLHNANDESALFIARMEKNERLAKLIEPNVSEQERSWVEEHFSEAYAARLKLDGEIHAAIHVGETERMVEMFTTTGRRLDTPLEPTFDYPLEEAIHAYYGALNKTREPPPSPFDFAKYQEYQKQLLRGGYPPNHDDPRVQVQLKLIHTLIDMGAPVDRGVYFPPIDHVCGMHGNAELLLKMLAKPCDVDARTTMDQKTPLMSAVVCYQVEIARILLAHGADPNARNNHGESVLQKARGPEQYRGPNPCVPLLLEAGAVE